MKRKINLFLMLSIVFVVALTTIGYSVLNRELKITGELAYKVPADIRITNVKLGDNKATEKFSPKFSSDEIILGYELNDKDSYITYKIEVTNFSDFDMGILKIEGVDNLELEGYTLKTKLVDTKGNSKAGMIKEFTITLRSVTDRIRIYFEPIYQITYDGFSNTISYKKEIMEGETLRNTFTEDVEDIIITMNDKTLLDYDNHDDYQFVNKELVLENVNGNILIENNTPNAPVLNGDMIPVYYDEGVGEWRKADINNLNNNWYDYKNQKWANAVTVVEESVEDLSGNYNNGAVHGATISNGEAYLDGIDDYIGCGLANYDFKNSFSAKIRFKIESYPLTAEGYIIGNAENAGLCLEICSDKKFYFRIHDGSKYISVNSDILELNKWYEAIATFDGINLKLTINDGNKVSNYQKALDMNSNIKPSIMPFHLGENPQQYNTHYLSSNVSISYVSLYDRTISEEEITGNNIKRDNLLLEYDFKNINTRSDYLNAQAGEIIPITDINTMWVWIPRYSYTIKSEDKTNYYGRASFGNNNPTRLLPGAIDIKFVSNKTEQGKAQYTGNKIDNYRTNDAFNFDNKTRAGIWIAKFELTGYPAKADQACVDEACDVSSLSILPNKVAITSQTVSSFFFAARSMQTHDSNVFGFNSSIGDLHMAKNDEWGAVAYLSQSRYGKYGNSDYTGANKEIYQNKSSDFLTGSSNATPGQATANPIQYVYNDMSNLGQGKVGPGASTTGTIYGVYDMSGGSWEYLMGVLIYDPLDTTLREERIETDYSGFIGVNTEGNEVGTIPLPEEKYYYTYKIVNPESGEFVDNAFSACNKGVCYGHALSETFGASKGSYGWYNNFATFVRHNEPWFEYGSYFGDAKESGIFSVQRTFGGGTTINSTRLILIAE